MKKFRQVLTWLLAIAVLLDVGSLAYRKVLAQTHTFPALDTNNIWSGTNTFDAKAIFNAFLSAGPSPWIDVTAPPYSAACDGSTDDSTAIGNAGTAAETTPAGTIFIPPGKTCKIASRWVLDNFVGVTVMGGFGARAAAGNTQATLNFTGNCSAGACLSERSTTAVHFINVGITCSGMTTSPCVDLSHSSSLADTSLDQFNGVAFKGPGAGAGALILDQNTDFVSFGQGTTFTNADAYVIGPLNNAALYTDSTTFDHVFFFAPFVAAVQNVSIKWKFDIVEAQLGSGSSCLPFIQYVNSYTNEGNVSITNSTFEPGTTGPCTNSFSVINTPPVVLANNFGGITFNDNLVLFDTGSTAGNVISLGNNQYVTARGNLFSNAQVVFALGTGNNLNVGANNYAGTTSLLSGTPAGGSAVDQNGITHFFQPLMSAGTQPVISGTGACASTSTKIGGSGWGFATCTGSTGASTLILTPTTAAAQGFNCFGSDTTPGTPLGQSGVSATTCTLKGTITANDVISWHVESE